MQVNPEKAAKHAAAAARKALEAAQHAHKAAMYAGLQHKNVHEAQPWNINSKCEFAVTLPRTTNSVSPKQRAYQAKILWVLSTLLLSLLARSISQH